MKNIFVFAIIIFLFLFTSCKRSTTVEKKEEVKTVNTDTPVSMNDVGTLSETELKKIVINKGDSESYETLGIRYMDYEIPEECLFYSLIMAEEYNCVQANYDIFSYIYTLYSHKPKSISRGFSQIAITYLLKAAKLGHYQALTDIKKYSVTESSDPYEKMQEILKE